MVSQVIRVLGGEIFGWRDPTSESPVLQLVDLTDNKPTLAETVAYLYGVHPEVVAYMTTMNAHLV